MSEWWTYTLADFLMFSPQVYYRLFELYNRALWPAQLLPVGMGFAILYVLLRREGARHGLIAATLGAIWLWLAWAFFRERYAPINWAAAYVAPLIAAEGLVLIWLAAIARRPMFTSSRKPSVIAGLGLFAFALVIYPFLAPLLGRSWLSGEIFGIAPDPTAVATLSLLALAEGRVRWFAMPIPALWCAISSITLWTMGAGDFFIPLAGAVAALGVAFAAPARGGRPCSRII